MVEYVESEQNKISTTIKRKAPLKSEVIAQFKVLQDKFNVLEIENTQNICIIRNMESKLKDHDREKPLNVGNPKLSKHDKDFISYFESDYPCSVCDRWCRSQKELNRHMNVFHSKRVKSC